VQDLVTKNGFTQTLATNEIATSIKMDECGSGIAVGDCIG